MNTEHIRNFSIIAHIDHGKSTLADRILEITGAVSSREKKDQLLDDMDIERERGITIKASAVTMNYVHDDVTYMLNLIDTPGHVDFHYEVSRSLAACEGALLVVDATQGVQAQTVANAYLAVEAGWKLLGVINKVDLPAAQPDITAEEIEHIIGIRKSECFHISAKTGIGVKELLDAIVTLLPPPPDRSGEPTAALIFDSLSDEYRGVICYVRVFAGSLKLKQKITLMGSERNYIITELGKLTPKMTPVDELRHRRGRLRYRQYPQARGRYHRRHNNRRNCPRRKTAARLQSPDADGFLRFLPGQQHRLPKAALCIRKINSQ